MKKDSVYNRAESFFNSWYNLRKGFELFYNAHIGDLNIRPAEGTFLSKIYYQPGISQREIAHALGVSEANVAKTFKKLERKELVYKTIDTENNARRNLFLTEKGEESIEKFMAMLDEFDEILFKDVREEELAEGERKINAMVNRLLDALEKSDQ